MTAACLTLLASARRPLWPWTGHGTGLLAEAFPAAQLAQWNLPHAGYNGNSTSAARNRQEVLAGLRARIQLGVEAEAQVASSADALDAVLCGFAGVGITRRSLASTPDQAVLAEGWIAVHS